MDKIFIRITFLTLASKKPKAPVGIGEYSLKPINYILIDKNISILGSPQFPLDLHIYDLTGRILFRTKIMDNKQINLSSILNSGLYLFSITNFKQVTTRLEIIK
ncbi:MAG: T9SS type A sorting domain-containing protein [Bacteroidetes bacterium]|nr:T9SS type A sorting domain-containing protein [Bacteroidota bacterium]